MSGSRWSTWRGAVRPTRPPVMLVGGDTPLTPRPSTPAIAGLRTGSYESGCRRAQGRLWGFAPLDSPEDTRRRGGSRTAPTTPANPRTRVGATAGRPYEGGRRQTFAEAQTRPDRMTI